MEIIDLAGKLILAKEIEGQAEFDISKFANGIYMVSVKDASGAPVKVTRIVKN